MRHDIESFVILFLTTITQMSPQILRRVLDRPLTDLTITPAILPDHSRRHVRGADYPGMIAHKGSEVRGTFVTGLNDRDIGRLDVFEGPQYVKRNVRVRLISEEGQKSGNGARKVGADGLVEAETYIFLNKKDLEEKEWDYEEFKREKLSRWVGSNEEYEGLCLCCHRGIEEKC